MERLTAREKGIGTAYFPYCFREDTCKGLGLKNCVACEHEERVCEKLAHYEDLEEQGSLIELPCAVGDTVYMIQNNADACEDCRWLEEGYCMNDYCSNKEVIDEDGNCYPSYPQYSDIPLCEKQFYEVVEHKPDLNWIFGQRNNFGKTIFLTEDEAKQALAEMQKG